MAQDQVFLMIVQHQIKHPEERQATWPLRLSDGPVNAHPALPGAGARNVG